MCELPSSRSLYSLPQFVNYFIPFRWMAIIKIDLGILNYRLTIIDNGCLKVFVLTDQYNVSKQNKLQSSSWIADFRPVYYHRLSTMSLKRQFQSSKFSSRKADYQPSIVNIRNKFKTTWILVIFVRYKLLFNWYLK